MVDAGTHVLVRIEPGPVVARVTGDGILAPFAALLVGLAFNAPISAFSASL